MICYLVVGNAKKGAIVEDVDWESGRGLISIDNARMVDAAFGRGEQHVGIAVVGLSLNCSDLNSIVPRVVRAINSEDRETKRLGFTAIAHIVRRFRALPRDVNQTLQAYKQSTLAEIAIEETIQYVPFRELPKWLQVESCKAALKWHLLQRWRS